MHFVLYVQLNKITIIIGSNGIVNTLVTYTYNCELRVSFVEFVKCFIYLFNVCLFYNSVFQTTVFI